MDIKEIYDILRKEISHNLAGELIIHDTYTIKWQLDGIGHGHDEEDLEELAQDDIDLINEVLREFNLLDYVEITDPEFDDVFVYFFINEL